MTREPSPPLAYFLTWTCYGQRVHGDMRGSIDDKHNLGGTPTLPPDSDRENFLRNNMRGETFELTPEMSLLADKAIRALCGEKHWRCLALNVRRTHVHIVIDCPSSVSPERALAAFKARITRDLRQAHLVDEDSRLWTAHGSTRWINHAAGLCGAISYVNEWQSGKKKEWVEEQKILLRRYMQERRAEREAREIKNSRD